jgi:hypothetical protein
LSGERGQPAYQDDDAIEEIRRMRREHPKWILNKAALTYANAHLEDKANP